MEPYSDTFVLGLITHYTIRSGLVTHEAAVARIGALSRHFHDFDPDLCAAMTRAQLEAQGSTLKTRLELRAAIVDNARALVRIRAMYGSFAGYVRNMHARGMTPEHRVGTVLETFSRLGPVGAGRVLHALGDITLEQIPAGRVRR